MKPAIVAVGYNRPNILMRLLDSISKADYATDDITLIISIDKAENEKDVLKVAEDFIWEYGKKIVRTFDERQGLRSHIIQCGDLSKEYGAVIVLEDDLLVSPGYYSYVCQALQYYNNAPEITGIALYSHEWNGYAGTFFRAVPDEYDTFLGQFSITWGQCWTYEWWKKFKAWYINNEDKLIENHLIPKQVFKWSSQSWGKYFVNYIVENDLYYVIPRISLSTNCSEVGQHAEKRDTDHQVALLRGAIKEYRFAPTECAKRYDIFFENKSLSRYLPQDVVKDGVTVNLSGYNRNLDADENRYILTTNSMDYKIVKSYGLFLRPIDDNVIQDMPGGEIFLYDTNEQGQKPDRVQNRFIRYEIRGISNRKLLKYVLNEIKKKIFR